MRTVSNKEHRIIVGDSLRKKVFSGLLWRFGERFLAQGISLVVSIILARLLTPDDYGAIAMVEIFVVISNVFVDGGFNNALVQKKDSDLLDFTTVFKFSFVLSIGIYLLLFLLSPLIAAFYGIPVLSPVLRVLSIQVIISSLKSVQVAYVQKNMMFKKFFWATLGGTIGSAFVGIYMAYNGFGIWALVGQHLFNTIVDTIVLWFTVKWRPTGGFSTKALSKLFSFGWKILVWSLFMQIFDNIRSFVIGKKYSSADLAYYTRGKAWPNLVVSNVNATMSSVLFPALAQYQDDKSRLKTLMRRSNSIALYGICPILFGLMALAQPLVSFVLTDKWLPSVPFLQIACVYMAFFPIQTVHLEAVKAIGRGDVLLKMDAVIKVLQIVLLIITMQISVEAIAISSIVVTIISTLIYGYSSQKYIGYKYLEQLRDVFSGCTPALVMSAIVYGLTLMLQTLPTIFILVIGLMVGVGSYFLISLLTHSENYYYLKSIIIDKLKQGE